MSARGAAALLFSSIVLLLSGLVQPTAAQCTTLDPPCPDIDEAPAIGISPGTGRSFSEPGVSVQITWTDDGVLNASSRSIKLNGTTVSLGYTSYSSGSAKSTGVIQLAPGSNTLSAYICDTNGKCDSRLATYTYNAPPPPQAYALPAINLAPHNPGVSRPSPLDGVASYTAPAYISMDEPRSVTLVYSSSRAKPMGFVQLDAYDNSTSAVSRMRLRVKDAGGAYVPFINGNTDVYYLAKHGDNRLAAQWDASALSTGAHKYTVEVTTYFADGTTRTSVDTTRVIVVKEPNKFGIGWGLAGLQRLELSQSSEGILVLDGDGSAVWFRKVGGGYVAPDGEFSTLHDLGSSFERRYPDGTKATFSSAGALLNVKDRFNRTTAFGYTSGSLTSITDPAGKQITLAYDGSGRLTSISDPVSRVTDVTVNGAGDLTSILAPGGAAAFAATYDADHRIRTRTDDRSKTWGYAYDFSGRLAADTLPTILANGANQRPVIRYTSFETAALVSGCACNRPHLRPDTLRARITDPAGNVTRIAFDRFQGSTRIEAPLNHTTIIDRNVDGLPVRIEEPDGTTRSFGWNADGMLESFQQPETGQSVTVTYHPTWRSEPSITKVGASEIRYSYGGSGQLLSVRVGSDSTRYEYHPDWRVKKVTDPEGHSTSWTYQASGFKNLYTSVVTSSSGTARTTTYGYDAYGRTSSVADPAGTTSYLYDLTNRVTQVTDALSKVTSYGYDGMHVDSVKDASNKVFRYSYNALGQLESETDPNGRPTYYRYDLAGNVTSILTRRNQQITFTPDALGRVISRTSGGATSTFAYDNPNGRWVAGWNSLSRDSIFYDERGRVEREVTVMNGRTYQILSFYAKEGQRDSVRIVTPSGARTVKYSYNNALQLTALTQQVGGVNKVTGITYNDDGLPSAITYPTSTQRIQSLTYTSGHLPTTNGWSSGLASLRVGYSYDSLERLKKRLNQAGDSARVFTYNNRGELTGYQDQRMTSEWVCPGIELDDCYWDEVTTVIGSDTYTYDAVGNRTDGATLQANSNRYQTFDGYSLVYYDDGYLSGKFKGGFAQYIEANNLGEVTKVTTGGVVVNYGYNAFGERVYRSSLYDTRYYVYDGDDLALEVDGSGNLLRQYTYFPGIDRPHSMFDENGTVYYYAADYPGHVAGLFNASGNVANRYRYSPWGEPEVTSEGVANTLRFMGRERDWDSGLYYVRSRWYDPHLGRFISEDPIGLNGGINWYTYAGNSPTNTLDPTGLCAGYWYNVMTVLRSGYSEIVSRCITYGNPSPSSRGSHDFSNVPHENDVWTTGSPASGEDPTPITRCISLAGAVAMNGALDYFTLTGIGAGLRLGGLALRGGAMTLGAQMGHTAAAMGFRAEIGLAFTSGRTSGAIAMGMADVFQASAAAWPGLARTAEASVYEGMLHGNPVPSAEDIMFDILIPLRATKRSLDNFARECW